MKDGKTDHSPFDNTSVATYPGCRICQAAGIFLPFSGGRCTGGFEEESVISAHFITGGLAIHAPCLEPRQRRLYQESCAFSDASLIISRILFLESERTFSAFSRNPAIFSDSPLSR